MPQKDSAARRDSEDKAAVHADSGALQLEADSLYDGLSEAQRGVEAAKQRAEQRMAAVTKADTKAEQVERMDRRVMNGSVFAQAAQLDIPEAGYDGEEGDGAEEAEGQEVEAEEDDEEEATTTVQSGDERQ